MRGPPQFLPSFSFKRTKMCITWSWTMATLISLAVLPVLPKTRCRPSPRSSGILPRNFLSLIRPSIGTRRLRPSFPRLPRELFSEVRSSIMLGPTRSARSKSDPLKYCPGYLTHAEREEQCVAPGVHVGHGYAAAAREDQESRRPQGHIPVPEVRRLQGPRLRRRG